MNETITLVAIAKNECKYICEWVAYHLAIGIDKIIVYDNESNDDTLDLLTKIAELDGRVTAREWHSCRTRHGSMQLGAYDDAFVTVSTSWFMCLDIDEFLNPFGFSNVRDFLRSFGPHDACVHVNWRGFGSAGCTDVDYELVLRTFSQASNQGWENNYHYKSLARSDAIYEVDIHDMWIRSGNQVMTDGRQVYTRGTSYDVVWDRVQINHYQCKTYAEFKARMAQGNATLNPDHAQYRRDDSIERFNILDRNEHTDLSIRKFDRLFDREWDRFKIARIVPSTLPELTRAYFRLTFECA